MPNWCSNRLTVHGPAADLAEFHALTSSRPQSITCDVQADTIGDNVRDSFSLSALYPIPDALSQDYVAARKWCLREWGVMRDRCISVRAYCYSESLFYHFETPWTPPDAWMQAVSAKFPAVFFGLAYAEWDLNLYGYLASLV
jgi:hypothetical protein